MDVIRAEVTKGAHRIAKAYAGFEGLKVPESYEILVANGAKALNYKFVDEEINKILDKTRRL